VGADLIPQGRRLQVRLAVPRTERAEFMTRLRMLSEGLPIAAQLVWTLTDEDDPPDASHSPAAGANSSGSLVSVNAQPPP